MVSTQQAKDFQKDVISTRRIMLAFAAIIMFIGTVECNSSRSGMRGETSIQFIIIIIDICTRHHDFFLLIILEQMIPSRNDDGLLSYGDFEMIHNSEIADAFEVKSDERFILYKCLLDQTNSSDLRSLYFELLLQALPNNRWEHRRDAIFDLEEEVLFHSYQSSTRTHLSNSG